MPDIITELAKRQIERLKESSYGVPFGRSSIGLIGGFALTLLASLHTDEDGTFSVSEIHALLDDRHERGLATYKVSLTDADLTEAQVIQHACEEAADLLKYLIKLAIIRAKKAVKA